MDLDAVKYLAASLAAAISFFGAWFFQFTVTDQATNKKRLTKFGRFAFVAAVASLVLSAYLSIEGDRRANAERALAAKELRSEKERAEKFRMQVEAEQSASASREGEILDELARLREEGGVSDTQFATLMAIVSSVEEQNLPREKSEFESIDAVLEVQVSRTDGFAGYDDEIDILKKNFPDCAFDIPDSINIGKFSKTFCDIRKTFFSTMRLGKASDFVVSMEWMGDDPVPTVVKRFAMAYGANRAEEFYDFIVQSTQAAAPRSVFCLPGHLKAYSIAVEDIYDACLDRNQN